MATQPKPQTFHRSSAEMMQLNEAILALHKAKSADTEQRFIELTKLAYSFTRQIVRGRLD